MRFPTKAEIDTAGRYATAVAGTAITIFGLQAKGISLDQAKAVIQAAGDTVNQLGILIAAAATLYATFKGIFKSGPAQQVASVVALTENPDSSVSRAAKVALLDGAAGLDEVRTPIRVTDAALAAATSNDLVQAGGVS